MDRYFIKDDPGALEVVRMINEESNVNVDEYTKFKKPPTPIQRFYAGKAILLTGATGFVGKCFVEKVLRDCSDIKKLYLLVRAKRGVPIQEKMKKYFCNCIFDRVRKIDPNFEDKVSLVNGDLYEPNLGLSAEDRQVLIENVDIIVHNGAIVKFNESVSVALRTNVLGTKAMLDLAVACNHVEAFFYVSTAYSHCYQTHIKEEFYESPADLKIVQDMIAADEAAKYGMSNEDVKMFLGKWANIYTFTKSISEDLVRQYGERANFPCAVHRPSIVYGALNEPRIGWSGNTNGPIFGFMGAALGAVHAHYNLNEPLDLIPVDFTVNSLLAATYHMTKEWEREKKPRVYNFGSSVANPLVLRYFYKVLTERCPTVSSEKSLWVPSIMFVSRKWQFYLIHFFLHFIPALFADIALLVMGKKPRALSLFRLVTANMDWVLHFLSHGWRFYVTETRKVYEYISEEDRKLFNFDIWGLSWLKYSLHCHIGMRIYALKEPLDNIKAARLHYSRLKILHYVTLTVFYLVILYYVVRFYNYVSNLF